MPLVVIQNKGLFLTIRRTPQFEAYPLGVARFDDREDLETVALGPFERQEVVGPDAKIIESKVLAAQALEFLYGIDAQRAVSIE